MLGNNLLALLATFILALGFLRFMDFTAHRRWVSARLSRKIIHIGTGPLFVLCWLLFTEAPSSRYLAALVPLAFTIQFFLIGVGVIKDPASVEAMSRTGNPREILQGPLYYGIMFVLLTLIFWLETPIGIIALMILCGGDGLADIVGRRWGKRTLPWNFSKTWIGSFGMFFGGWFTAWIILIPFSISGVFPYSIQAFFLPTAIIAFGAMIIESLPLHVIDNLTIPAGAVIMGYLLFS